MSSHNIARSGGVAVGMDRDDNDEEEDQPARELLKTIGFDPDNIHKLYTFVKCIGNWSVTPIIYFCRHGNFKMVRYLVSRGADCRTADEYGCWPLLRAAMSGHFEIVQFLYQECGAQDDIRRVSRNDHSPLYWALHGGYFDVAKFLIRNGALVPNNDDDDIDDARLRIDLRPKRYATSDTRLALLAWAHNVVAVRDTIHVFLQGTILASSTVRRHPKNPYVTRSKRMKIAPSPLVLLKGKSGLLKLMVDYAGYPTPHELRMFRSLIRRLSAYIEDVPFVRYGFIEE